jgi:hypothetical protein
VPLHDQSEAVPFTIKVGPEKSEAVPFTIKSGSPRYPAAPQVIKPRDGRDEAAEELLIVHEVGNVRWLSTPLGNDGGPPRSGFNMPGHGLAG